MLQLKLYWWWVMIQSHFEDCVSNSSIVHERKKSVDTTTKKRKVFLTEKSVEHISHFMSSRFVHIIVSTQMLYLERGEKRYEI